MNYPGWVKQEYSYLQIMYDTMVAIVGRVATFDEFTWFVWSNSKNPVSNA